MLHIAINMTYCIQFHSLTYFSLDNCEFERICKFHTQAFMGFVI